MNERTRKDRATQPLDNGRLRRANKKSKRVRDTLGIWDPQVVIILDIGRRCSRAHSKCTPYRGLYGFWSRRPPLLDTPCSLLLAGVLRPVFHQGGVGGGPSPKCLKYQNPEKNGGSNLFRETAGQIQNHFCHRSRPSRSCATDKIPPPAAHRSSRSRGTRHLLQLNHAISSKNRPSAAGFQIKATNKVGSLKPTPMTVH